MCRRCQIRAINELPSYEQFKCPVCRTPYTNVTPARRKVTQLVSIRGGLLLFFILVLPLSPIVIAFTWSFPWYEAQTAMVVYWFLIVTVVCVLKCSAVALQIDCENRNSLCATCKIGLVESTGDKLASSCHVLYAVAQDSFAK